MSTPTPPPPGRPDGSESENPSAYDPNGTPQGYGQQPGYPQAPQAPQGYDQQPQGYGQPQAYGQQPGSPQAPQAPQDYGQPAARKNPGLTLAIVGLVLSAVSLILFGFLSIPGLILAVGAQRQSRAAGMKNPVAIVGIVVGAIAVVLWIITLVFLRR